MPNMSALTRRADALLLQRACEVAKYLVREVRERCPETARRRELRDEHGRLTHDRVDEQMGSHGSGDRQ
jgi:hypothetical protein